MNSFFVHSKRPELYWAQIYLIRQIIPDWTVLVESNIDPDKAKNRLARKRIYA